MRKSRNNCVVLEGTICIEEMLDQVLEIKGEAKRVNKIVKYNLYLIAHNGSGFDSYVVLKNLLQWLTVFNLNKNGSGNVSLKIPNGYADKNKKRPQYVHLKRGGVHINNSLKKIGVSFKSQESSLRKETDRDKIFEDTWKTKENEWLPYL